MNKEEEIIDERIFDFVYGMAVSDATRRIENSGDLRKRFENDKIKEVVKRYAKKVLECGNACFCSTVTEVENIDKNTRGRVNLKFGNIQKLINMTMKYLYILCYHNEKMREKFNNCHAPMDSVMRDFVFESYYLIFHHGKRDRKEPPGFRKSCSWSTIDDEKSIDEYKAFQDIVRRLIIYKGIKNKIEFDYIFWNNAKELVDKKVDEQQRIVSRIWVEYDKKYKVVS